MSGLVEKNIYEEIFLHNPPKVVVLGGDNRELILIKALIEEGFHVNIFAQAKELAPKEAYYCQSIKKALVNMEAVILPMAGINNEGILFCKNFLPCRVEEDDFSLLAEGTPVYSGVVSDYLKKLGIKYNLDIIAMADKDEIAIPNAVPTAEGAIALAIENSPGVIYDSTALIIGYGRVGQALAERLRALGSEVLVTNRGKEREIEAHKLGYKILPWDKWQNSLHQVDYIYNTVPVMLITEAVMEKMKKTALIIDLASLPGGTDFKSADEKKIKAIFAPSLPGRFSPLTAGKILAETYPGLIKGKIAQKRRGKQ